MAVREGKWLCPGCNTKNRGRDLHCQACGEARGEVEFFLDDEDPEVQDPALLAEADAGPDWVCHYCGQSSPGSTRACVSCGGPRGEGKDRNHGEVIRAGYHSLSEQARADRLAAMRPYPQGGSGAAMFAKLFGVLAGGLLVLMCLGSAFLFTVGRAVPERPMVTEEETTPPEPTPLPPREALLEVRSVSWQRTVHIERLVTVQESARTVPPGGRLLSQSDEVDSYKDVQVGTRPVTKSRTVQVGTRPVAKTRRVQTGTRQVKVGARNKGNGFFEDVYKTVPVYGDETYTVQEPVYGPEYYTVQEPVYERKPVYATIYRYEIERWRPDHDVTSRGDDLAPSWPEVRIAPEDAPRLHESGRDARYTVLLREPDGTSRTLDPSSEQSFVRFVVGSRWNATIEVESGRILTIDPAPANVAAVTSASAPAPSAAPEDAKTDDGR